MSREKKSNFGLPHVAHERLCLSSLLFIICHRSIPGSAVAVLQVCRIREQGLIELDKIMGAEKLNSRILLTVAKTQQTSHKELLLPLPMKKKIHKIVTIIDHYICSHS